MRYSPKQNSSQQVSNEALGGLVLPLPTLAAVDAELLWYLLSKDSDVVKGQGRLRIPRS